MALATVACASALCTSAFMTGLSDAAGAVIAHPRASTTGTTADPAVVTVHHARECASVRRASATTIVIPVVVDLGGSSDPPAVSCVPVPTGSSGAQVLATRARLLRVPAPRYAISGLLCAIDGYPATGCGQQNGTHYAYWAYFHGGSSWTYASGGPAAWKVSVGDVEGWRFEPDGSATPADPPPPTPSDAPTLCPTSVSPTTTTTSPSNTPPTTSPPTTVPPDSSPSGGHGGTGSASSLPVSPDPKPFVAATGASRPAPSGQGPGSGTAPTTSTPPPSGASDGATSSGPETSGRRIPTHLASKRDPGHDGAPIGIILAVALIALLAVGAVIRTRRATQAQ